MAELQQVELVRRRVVAGFSNEVARFRGWISMVDGNGHAVELLRGESGERLAADIVELVMGHLGHVAEITRLQDGGNGRASQSRKATRGKV